MLVPFYGCAREYAQHKEQILSIADEVLSSGQILQGIWVEEFEQNLANFVGREYAVAVGSCTDALFFALKALGIKEGDKVLVPNFTFPASATCVLRAKAIPVFVDVDPYGNMDLDQAATLMDDQVKAVIYVHLYGQMGNPRKLWQFARNHDVPLIEDAAQALGSSYEGIKAGSVGIISCFSFDPTKPMNATGSGGAIVCDRELYANAVKNLRYHSNFDYLGYNSQMPSLMAAILSYKLDRSTQFRECRAGIAAMYKGLNECPILLPYHLSSTVHNYHKYVIQTEKRSELRTYLMDLGIETKAHYQSPLSALPVFKGYGFGEEMYPNSFKMASTVLSLPCHPYLTLDEVQIVIQSIKNFFKGN